MKITPALLVTAALALAACGGSSAPPTAAQIARRLPGCHKPYTPPGGVAVQASQEQECLTGTAVVDVATFTSASLERQWITAQNAGTCEAIQGQGWAALVLPAVTDFCKEGAAVAKALGGRMVSG